MKTNKTNINFHQTFKPERQYLSSLLSNVNRCQSLDIREISNLTGIPTGASSGKVEPTICYAMYMDLIFKEKGEGKYRLSFTPLGERVYTEDPVFFEKLTLLITHCMLVRQFSGAEIWSYIFNTVFPRYKGRLTRSEFDTEVISEFGKGVKLAPFFGTYMDLLKSLNVLEISDENIVLLKQSINPDFVYLYALVLFSYWDEWLEYGPSDLTSFASDYEINASHLNNIGFKNPFGWDESQEFKVLELLASKNLIILNKQMLPFTLTRIVEKSTLITKLYSELS